MTRPGENPNSIKNISGMVGCTSCSHVCPACPGHPYDGDDHWVGRCGYCCDHQHGPVCQECGVPSTDHDCDGESFAAKEENLRFISSSRIWKEEEDDAIELALDPKVGRSSDHAAAFAWATAWARMA